MSIAITGASGHVGNNLVRTLIERGESPRVLVHKDAAALEGLDVERVEGDVCDPDSMRSFCAGATTVFHLAAVISITGERGGLVPAVNVEGVRNVALAALEAGVERMVHVSSIHAFDHNPADQPLDETRGRPTPAHPAYDRSKAAGEAALREVIDSGLDAVIVNPTGIIGPNDYEPSRMGRVLLDLKNRRLPAVVTSAGFDFVDVRDVVGGALAAAESGRTGENYILSGHFITVKDLAAMVEGITGSKPPLLSVPMWTARAVAPFFEAWGALAKQEPIFTREALHALRGSRDVRHDKARSELGYDPQPLEQTVRETLAWFQSPASPLTAAMTA